MTGSGSSVNYHNVRYRLMPARQGRPVSSSAWPGLGVSCGTTSRLKNREVYQLHEENPKQDAKPSVGFFSLGKQFTEPGNSAEFP